MKVAIIGGGSIGLLFATFFKEAKIETVLYTNREEQADKINLEGIWVVRDGLHYNTLVQALPFREGIKENYDLIIVTVKQYQLQPILNYLTATKNNSPILFLQNGMGHIYTIQGLLADTILVGVVEHGALKQSDNTVEHTGIGQVRVSGYRGEYTDCLSIFQSLNNAGYTFKVEDEWYAMLIRKLVVNAVINPLTVLYKCKNGMLVDNPHFLENMKLVYQEVMTVVVIPNEKRLWDDLVTICQNTSSNYSSMYMDIKNNRKTEIEAILGYLLTEAEVKNQRLPLVKFLYESVKGIDGEERRNGNG